tara:strand:- start:113 stop:280 length:168 start_codon:yes stop_codon:yes gene_type:complete
MTSQQKKELLKRLAALMVFNGIDISDFFRKSLDAFDYDLINQSIQDFERAEQKAT